LILFRRSSPSHPNAVATKSITIPYAIHQRTIAVNILHGATISRPNATMAISILTRPHIRAPLISG
jgi:hypothetical protein